MGKEYNLDAIKEIKVTDSFLSLSQDVIECQNEESYDDCATKKYIDSVLDQCECVPFNIRTTDEVKNFKRI